MPITIRDDGTIERMDEPDEQPHIPAGTYFKDDLDGGRLVGKTPLHGKPLDEDGAIQFHGQRCERCDGDGKAHGADRPFEWSGPGTYPGPCPVCHGTGRKSASKLAREIAARVWCDQEMRQIAMDVDAAEAIARIIDGVRHAQADKQSYDDLAASGGIVEAP